MTNDLTVGKITPLSNKSFSNIDRIQTANQRSREILSSIQKIEEALKTNDLKTIREECFYVKGLFS